MHTLYSVYVPMGRRAAEKKCEEQRAIDACSTHILDGCAQHTLSLFLCAQVGWRAAEKKGEEQRAINVFAQCMCLFCTCSQMGRRAAEKKGEEQRAIDAERVQQQREAARKAREQSGSTSKKSREMVSLDSFKMFIVKDGRVK